MSERRLEQGWELLRCAPGAYGRPEQLPTEGWSAAVVPGTVAMSLGPTADLDAYDHWYRCTLPKGDSRGTRRFLCFDGLATLGEVWLNGTSLFESDNMFVAHRHDVTDLLNGDDAVHVRFRALLPVLRERRPRGRFPTRFVAEKNLRFVRTSLIGYMPGICPPVRPVGPWRAVRLVEEGAFAIEGVELRPVLEGARGVLEATIRGRSYVDGGVFEATLEVGSERLRTTLQARAEADGTISLRGRAVIEHVERWWPHTHGRPALYPVTLELDGQCTDLGSVGFRTIELLGGDQWALAVNGTPIFCRGACFMPLDMHALHVSADAYRKALVLVRDAGMNMLRLSGPMVYESDAFHRLCDELGILIWQDFMFARMDYPEEPAFLASAELEARQLLARLAHRPSLAVLCGNNEVAQQAGMMGMPAEATRHVLFDSLLCDLSTTLAPGVPYVASSPSGGELAFHSGPGPSHYFGVGGYMRPIEDARIHRLRFASECLCFANVPEDVTLRAWLGEEGPPSHHPRYLQRIPRDSGAAWDFADLTEHYAERLFRVELRQIRYADPERHLALCRAALVEVMTQVQSAWRSPRSSCKGAIVLQLNDHWEGAGWGIIDSSGLPKSAYYGLKRVWAPLGVWITDEGLDGLVVHVANDTEQARTLSLTVDLYRSDGMSIEHAALDFPLAPRTQREFGVDALVGHFVDSSYAYRFGPPAHEVVAARLSADGVIVGQAFHQPLGLTSTQRADTGLSAVIAPRPDGSYLLTASAERFAEFVVIDAPGYMPSDNYFHLAPKQPWHVVLQPRIAKPPPLRAKLRALNASSIVQARSAEAEKTR